ncbi:MAG: hypothetical protein KUG56_05510 [Kordiimonadaceae bacterium]|nr:hypothetical protein [Kordiimonadaceae bacterium]
MPQPNMNQLQTYISAEWQRDLPVAVLQASKAILADFGDAASGMLFYGSCLRTGEVEDKILDFYVLVDSYSAAYKKRWLAWSNKLLPPNVFYHEMDIEGVIVRSKYAVLSLEDFASRVAPNCLNVSVWARFCQPCILIQPKDASVERDVASYVATAITTMLGNLLDLFPNATTSRKAWVAAFEETYAAELRSERAGKGLEIYLLDQERYDTLFPLAIDALSPSLKTSADTKSSGSTLKGRFKWMARRWNGKFISMLRLIKATMTFDGGIDYLAWKIRRHSGVEVEVTDWMRKYPVFAGLVLFVKLRKNGAFK